MTENKHTEFGVIVEYQQEILLDEEDARFLRDKLTDMLKDDEP